MFHSTKTYGHERGFSCAFRQHRADSHCKYLHGYSLAFKFVFSTEELDVRNWAVDFGGMKSLKAMLESTFDHKTIVASDDPQIAWFREGQALGTLELVEVEAGGCERFAELVYECTEQWLKDSGYGDRIHLDSVEVAEHPANSAIYSRARPCSETVRAMAATEYADSACGVGTETPMLGVSADV